MNWNVQIGPVCVCFSVCPSVYTALAMSTKVTVKREKFERADYFRDIGICESSYCKELRKKIASIATTTDLVEKRAQRDLILGQLEIVLAILPTHLVANVLIFGTIQREERLVPSIVHSAHHNMCPKAQACVSNACRLTD